ncbi:unnamed protein product [Mucor hiemalis]
MEDEQLAEKQPMNVFTGFTTGKGKPLPPPSEEAKLKTAQIFEGLDEGLDKAPPMMLGFSTAGGRKLQPVSEEARKKAQALFDDIKIPELSSNESSKNEKKAPKLSGFATASGNLLKPPSKDAIESASSLFGVDAKTNNKRTVTGDLKYDKAINQFGGFTTGNSKKSFDISSQARRKAVSIVSDIKEVEKPISPLPSPSLNRNTSGFTFPKRNANRAIEVKKQNKQFKSPIIKSNFELTKAAVNNRNFTKSKAKPVFDLKVPEARQSLASLGKPAQYTRTQLIAKNIPIAVINMTASNANKYVFDNNWGPKQAREDLIQAGAMSNRASLAWVENHYGLIVWKIASFIRSYPDAHTHEWNSKTILNQLLYRYEREINMGHRPILKKILEQDDLSVKHMLLMVSDIVQIKQPLHFNTSHLYRLELTDGWYRVPTCIDYRMERAITRNKLKIGSKLSVCGAKIIGDLEARSPLEITNTSTMLLITTNSSLPASWDTKLGYHPRKLTIRSMPTIFDDGGMVTALDVIVCRKFPMLYSETLSNGSVITRTAKEEEEARRNALGYDRFESSQQVTVNFKADQRTHLNRSTRGEAKKVEERRVSGYFKIRICDASSKGQQIATLLLSNANELNHIDVVEGNRYRVFFVMPYHPKNKKYPGLDLKTTRMTRWEPRPSLNSYGAYIPRYLTPCKNIRQREVHADFDVVVLVLQTGTATMKYLNGRKLWHQTLLVTDDSQSVCQINFRLPLGPFPDIKGQVVGFVNLRFEMYDTKFDITCLRATDETETITKISSCAEYIQKGLLKLKQWVSHNPQEVEQVTHRIQNILQ